MITAVYLNGALGAKWGRRWRLDVETPKEVIDAIDCARPGFRQAYLELTGYVFRVRVGKAAIRRGQEERLGMKHGGKSISITPVLEAHANTKGIIYTIVGVVLFLADVFVFHTGYLAGLGLSLALSGSRSSSRRRRTPTSRTSPRRTSPPTSSPGP
jgi:predicted phage tail protein